MEKYPRTLLAHLGKYRQGALNVREPGIFRYRGQEIAKDHILPDDQRKLNFLPLVRDKAMEARDAEGIQKIKWHRYSHHLNSSQVLTINLMLPVLDRGDALPRALGVRGPLKKPTGFEWVPDKQEGSNLDFVVTGSDGRRIVMEFKLTERDFGRAADDEEHRDKFSAIYAEKCGGRLALPKGSEWEVFREHYQFFRNVLFADENCRVWFVLPEPHRSLWKLAEESLSWLTPGTRRCVELKTLKELLESIEREAAGDGILEEHYREFRSRYGPAV